MTPQSPHRFHIDYEGDGYLSVPVPPRAMPPPADPLEDPWLTCAMALGRARQGDFGLMPSVLGLYGRTQDTPLDHVCLALVTSAGTTACLARISETVANADKLDDVFDLCGVLAAQGALSSVPILLDKYLANPGHRDAERLTDYLFDILGPQLFSLPADDYEEAVLHCWERMRADVAQDDALLLQGQLYGVVPLARLILQESGSPYFRLGWKLQFESSTGMDCSAWYQDKKPRPLAIAAAMEAFLESDEAGRYEDGARYFFGHRIP